MKTTGTEWSRRRFLRGAAALGLASLSTRLLADDGKGAPDGATALPFEPEPGSEYELVASLVSGFGKAPEDVQDDWDRGGLFRSEYRLKVLARDAAGLVTVALTTRRVSGGFWDDTPAFVLFDSADPRGQVVSTGKEKPRAHLFASVGRVSVIRLSPRGEFLGVKAGSDDPAPGGPGGNYMRAESNWAFAEFHRLFAALPPRPVRPGETHGTWVVQDGDPNVPMDFDNRVPLELGLRFEGTNGDIARFSLRGGTVAEPGAEDVTRAVNGALRWVDEVTIDGILDIDRTLGWVRARDQTMRIAYRRGTRLRSGKWGVRRVVNTRRLVVTGRRP